MEQLMSWTTPIKQNGEKLRGKVTHLLVMGQDIIVACRMPQIPWFHNTDTLNLCAMVLA